METPSPTDRRQRWARTSRRWHTLEEADPQSSHTPVGISSDNSALSEGCSTGKIESWLQAWGPEEGTDIHQSFVAEPFLKSGASFEDDLSLGAEALAFSTQADGPEIKEGRGGCPLLLPPPRPRSKGQATSTPNEKLAPPLSHLGHSTTSSALSSSSRTASSVQDLLQLYAEDAEDTLYQLGFGGCDEPQVTARIPARFFSFPSQLHGINFRVFLESQLARLHQEDPSLSLASRFRQVEVLAATANAFYSLYSHVSRTPLQKLAPPDMSFAQSPAETRMAPRFFSSARSEPKSPVERLKDTVSKMCLYTGSSLRSPEATSVCKRPSLPDVIEAVLERVKGGDTVAEQAEESMLGGDVNKDNRMENQRDSGKEREEQKTKAERHNLDCRDPRGRTAKGGANKAETLSISPLLQKEDSKTNQCTSSPLSKGFQLTSNPYFNPDKPSSTTDDAQTPPRSPPKSLCLGAKFSKDIICPQIMERVHQVPFSCLQRNDEPASSIMVHPDGNPRMDESDLTTEGQAVLGEEMIHTDTDTEVLLLESRALDNERYMGDVHLDNAEHLESMPSAHSDPAKQSSPCRITVTGWEGDTPATTKGSATISDVQETPDPESLGSRNFLNPVELCTLGQTPHSLQQANSFELEEVCSAGEDDPTQSDSRRSSSLLSAINQRRDFLLRGDSLQSDSSGYVEEDHPFPSSPEHDGSCSQLTPQLTPQLPRSPLAGKDQE
uniref:Thymocyte expressed, positive selection associated 1 n=1 Tax=Paramormyrops kingsleyae TaxID=1676925 RepID=A0A3B3RAZ1_9TELE|nr:protein TESPA1 isoform X1 [Paramormyrops kingsleyae]XP_023651190.1 protein TESPA1 isoform X1 [Paramormyrops kingsleyae]XP_023651191.1 protein TESPA1 isoform X1 [Paramormyrops kingsleyae]XP_023651192.1 protein TESPA1 isoform X1 [Paramormyrops kingsleyae]XP_023651193.1 protein TESPA1 isoform X1 [Paramormyrops kingsleyae]